MRKNRVIEQNRCYHLVSRLAHRAFFLDDEDKDRAVALMRRVEAGVKASMSYCINRTVSISSDPFDPCWFRRDLEQVASKAKEGEVKQGKVKRGIVFAALAAMAMTAGCVYTTVEDEFSLMWTRDDWRKDVFSEQLTEKWDGLDSAICDELQVRVYDEKDRRKACQAAKNIAANRLPALKALRREMAAENVAKTKTKRKERMLQDVDDLMASIRDAARDIPVLTLVPCANPDGVAFMGFDFDSKIEWNERDHSIDDSVEDGWFLNLEYELKSPYHGFESVEARGDVKSRLPYALIFNRYVVCEFSIDEARKWADELMRDFAGDCGIRLAVTDGSSDWIQLEGKSETLRVWACAGAYSELTFGRGEVQTEDGIHYQLDVRRLK